MIDPSQAGMMAIGAAVAVGVAGIGAGMAEASIGSVAVGAMTKNDKFFGKGLLMTVIPESIAIFGLVVALVIMFVF